MPQYLALESSETHARMILAITDATGIRVRQATELSAADAHSLLGKISDTVTGWGCSGAKTLVGVRREQCELRRLAVPDAGADEIPDLVRYQALQNFSMLGDDWPLDFIPLPKTTEGNHVLAGAISPERLRSIEELCERIGCPLEGIILSPCATAAVVHQVAPAPRGEGQVIVDLQSSDIGTADIFITIGPQTILMRSVRVPNGAPAVHAALLPEIRRTISSGTSTQPALNVTRVIVCGDGPADVALAKYLQGPAQLGLPVQTVKNWTGARIHQSLPDVFPENAGRFLPLIGMVQAETEDHDSIIDFGRPRQRPPAPDHSRTWKLVALLAAVLIGVAFFGIRSLLKSEDAAIARLQQQVKTNDQPVKDSEAVLASWFRMENWYQNSPNWLEELDHLSQQLPVAEKVRLTEIICNDQAAISTRFTETQDRGRVGIRGFLDDDATHIKMQTSLSDPQHRVVESGDRSRKPDVADYPWLFGDTIFVTTGVDAALATETAAETAVESNDGIAPPQTAVPTTPAARKEPPS